MKLAFGVALAAGRPVNLAVVVVMLAGVLLPVEPARAAVQLVSLSGVVHTRDGSPIGEATVTVGEQQLLADDRGRWQGAVAFATQLREFVTAPGYVAHGYRDIYLPSPNAVGPPLEDTLVSIFDADPDAYSQASGTPPTVDGFVTDAGISRSQEVPGSTGTITVNGSAGERDGRPIVRGDGYLGLPDDSVDQVGVSIQGDRFSATFPITHGAGAYRLEINDTTGAAIINVPMFVGVPYQAEPPIWPDEADLADGSVARALEALQQVRQAHGLAAYAVDPRLQRVAQNHVDDMVAHNWICHCWADGSGVLDHVQAAGVSPAPIPVAGHPNQYTLGVGNGISTAPGAAGIRGLFASPVHRKDLLGAYTHVGMAFAGQVTDGTSRLSIVYATEN